MAGAGSRFLVDGLIELLNIEELDRDLFRGPRKPGASGRIFGGQVIAQALEAANRTIDPEKVAHSLHAYFMRPGDDHLPLILEVTRDFDGRSFATRRVVAMQEGQPILTLTCSFQRNEPGFAHHASMPEVPLPDELPSLAELEPETLATIPSGRLEWMRRPSPIELKATEMRLWSSLGSLPPRQSWWVRVADAIGDDASLHRTVLAYMSDLQLLATSLLPFSERWEKKALKIASIDHALWFHEPFRADEWLLYTMDSPWSGHGRGLNNGRFYRTDGTLVASVAQEGLIRPG